MCLPPVAFPSLARGRAVLCRIWSWWPLLTTTYTYFPTNLTIKIISQILPFSLKSVRSCKSAAFEKNVLMQKGLYILFRGFQAWLKSGSGVFIVLGFMRYVLSNWTVKIGQAPTQKSNNLAPSSAKWWHHSPLVPLCVTKPCCLICRQT